MLEAPDPAALAEALVRAVEEFEVKHENFEHTEVVRSDGRKVRYTKHAKVNWEKGTITTNFVSEEGDLFISCMGSLVVELRKQDKAVPVTKSRGEAN
jgi:sporulation protein YlmC with PRC-barrel domain